MDRSSTLGSPARALGASACTVSGRPSACFASARGLPTTGATLASLGKKESVSYTHLRAHETSAHL
eukprot:13545593-Alexandrium_andersonii.AAC.1